MKYRKGKENSNKMIKKFILQVLPERVRHIEYSPAVPEPFYVPSGKEPRPKPLGDEFGTVIFRYHPTNVTSYVSL